MSKRLAIALALICTGLDAAAAAAATAQDMPTSERFANHPYKTALGAMTNLQSCGSGMGAHGAAARALAEEMRGLEAMAAAKGLGPRLEQMRRDYLAILAVSTMVACPTGARRALADARRAVAAFRAWVEAQPPAP